MKNLNLYQLYLVATHGHGRKEVVGHYAPQ